MPLNVVAVVEYCMAVGKGTLHLLFLHIRLLDSHLGGGGGGGGYFASALTITRSQVKFTRFIN